MHAIGISGCGGVRARARNASSGRAEEGGDFPT